MPESTRSSQSEIRNSQSTMALAPFVKLANPSTYVACAWDLTADMAAIRQALLAVAT